MYAIDEMRLISGIDVPIINLQETLHQPTLKEIAFMGQNEFFYCVSLLVSSDGEELSRKMKEEKGLAIEFTNLEAFYQMFFSDEKNNVMIFNSFFSLLFKDLKQTHWHPSQSSFVFKDKTMILNEDIFKEIKYVVSKITGMDKIKEKQTFNTTTDRAAEIAKKIEAHRRKVAQERANMGEDNGGADTLSNMISCMSTVSGLKLDDILNYTYYQLVQQYQRSLMLDGYHTQMSMAAFGGIEEDKIIDWQKSI